MDRKAQFIIAYVWMFGGTKKAAEKAYKEANNQYISEVIYGFNQNAKTSIYHD